MNSQKDLIGPQMPTPESENYKRMGFDLMGSVMSKDFATELKSDISDWLGPSPKTNQYGILRNNCWREIPSLERQLEPLAQITMKRLGTRSLTLFQDNLIWKSPRGQQAISWHQDFAYWPLSAPMGITVWIALDDSDEDNGCVHVIPESHTLGVFAATNFTEPGTASWADDQSEFELSTRL